VSREIPLSSGAIALVDDADYEVVAMLGPWHARPHGRTTYAQANVRRNGRHTTIQMHRLIMGADGPRIDHIDGNGLDNRRANLRPATQAQNSRNQRCSNPSGYKGVSATRGRWCARIWHEGKLRYLGMHDTPEAAARAYDDAAVRYFGEFARLNFDRAVM